MYRRRPAKKTDRWSDGQTDEDSSASLTDEEDDDDDEGLATREIQQTEVESEEGEEVLGRGGRRKVRPFRLPSVC